MIFLRGSIRITGQADHGESSAKANTLYTFPAGKYIHLSRYHPKGNHMAVRQTQRTAICAEDSLTAGDIQSIDFYDHNINMIPYDGILQYGRNMIRHTIQHMIRHIRLCWEISVLQAETRSVPDEM